MTDTISDSSKRKPPDAPEPTDRDQIDSDQIDSDQIDSDRMDREWLTSLLRPLLVVMMVSSIDIVLLAFLRQYAPDIAPATRWSIVGMGILAAIVGCSTTTCLPSPHSVCAVRPAIVWRRFCC